MKVTIELDNEASGTRMWSVKVTKVWQPPHSRKILTEVTHFGASVMYGLDEVIKRIPQTLKNRRAVQKEEEPVESSQ